MNQPFLLQMVGRLEGFLGKLPAAIQKPVLQELTPLKELFLQQRSPRFVLTGSAKIPLQEIIPALFGAAHQIDLRDALMEVFRWQKTNIGGHGTVELLDARGADASANARIAEELGRQPGDLFFHIADAGAGRSSRSDDLETLAGYLARSSSARPAKALGLVIGETRRAVVSDSAPERRPTTGTAAEKLRERMQAVAGIGEHLIEVVELPLSGDSSASTRLMALLTRILPNECRIEMARISRDRAAQAEIAQSLVKSTAAICAAVGTQPIPLADLPILTALQLMMVSGIMYISGRERNVRAATEFIAALGVNFGAGMILREGTRAALKFFPGWGNVVCGMVAGAGTYGIGKAATVYFLEGMTLRDARRAYVAGRKRRARPQLEDATTAKPKRRTRA
ncbi:MAG: hypothetical protein M3Z64_10575 [Verrucomicrobiota bacterium]|nr:hypothetical protein [Verrucomicrobiota bacterium]